MDTEAQEVGQDSRVDDYVDMSYSATAVLDGDVHRISISGTRRSPQIQALCLADDQCEDSHVCCCEVSLDLDNRLVKTEVQQAARDENNLVAAFGAKTIDGGSAAAISVKRVDPYRFIVFTHRGDILTVCQVENRG